MSRFTEAVAYAERHPGLTLNDLATALNYADPAERSSLKAQMRRAMAPGGTHRHLAERGIVKPGPEDAGANWAKGMATGETRLPVEARSKAFSDIYTLDDSRLPARMAMQQRKIVNSHLTGGRGKMVADYVLISSSEVEHMQDMVKLMEQLVETKDARIRDLEEMVALLRQQASLLAAAAAE